MELSGGVKQGRNRDRTLEINPSRCVDNEGTQCYRPRPC